MTTQANIIDATGLNCPMPLLKLKQAMAEIEPGESLEIWVTDPHAELDFEIWCERFGHRLIQLPDHPNHQAFKVTKDDIAPMSQHAVKDEEDQLGEQPTLRDKSLHAFTMLFVLSVVAWLLCSILFNETNWENWILMAGLFPSLLGILGLIGLGDLWVLASQRKVWASTDKLLLFFLLARGLTFTFAFGVFCRLTYINFRALV